MGSERYRVEVLHYLNPHLIWVEVVKPPDSRQSCSDFHFEQIGVYGILPLQYTIDIVEVSLKPMKSDEWQPTIRETMRQVIEEADEVWFSVVHIDRRNSIFDTNIHKYGEIVIKTKSGEYRDLSTILTSTNFAYADECAFLNELSNFKLKTTLSDSEVQKVIKQLEKSYTKKKHPKNHWEKSVKSHTSVFQMQQNFEASLTQTNIQHHNKLSKLVNDSIEEVIEKKRDDFKLCKDIDEVSIERTKEPSKELTNKQKLSIVAKRLNLMKRGAVKNSDTETAARYHHEGDDDFDDLDSPANRPQSKREDFGKKHSELARKEVADNSFEEYPPVDYGVPKMPKKSRKTKPSPKKIISYDEKTERLIAFGPPEFDKNKLCPIVVPKDTMMNKATEDQDKDEEGAAEIGTTRDGLAGLDSEVNFPINHARYKSYGNSNLSNNVVNKNAEPVLTVPLQVPVNDETLNKSNSDADCSSVSSDSVFNKKSTKVMSSALMKKLMLHKKVQSSDDKSTNGDDSDNETTLSCIVQRLKLDEPAQTPIENVTTRASHVVFEPNHVNPFKNTDPSISRFVDKLVSPVLMVHSKQNHRIQPDYELRDLPFSPAIFSVLSEMSIKRPMMLQTVTWKTILKGFSLFMVSPKDSGKTMGYTPAVCRLVADYDPSDVPDSLGPICIIVCATALSVVEVERQCRRFLGQNKKVISCYAGVDERHVTTSLLNGCDIFICTPSALVRRLNMADFGVDLRRLATFVFEDCERLNEVFTNEIKFFLIKIKEMLKNRANKVLKVQFILASRIWCEFMELLAKKAAKPVICIGSFQECVLYSKTNMSVSFVKKENKLEYALEFVKSIDTSKRTVIVCRFDEEVQAVADMLRKHKYNLFSADSTMTVEDLSSLCYKWAEYEEAAMGPILVCCDGNLTHLNITDAHFLLHYSLPSLFSMFSRRFAVLIDHYPSMFKETTECVKVKMLLEDTNVEQLPKILHFIKRCTNEVPESLDAICKEVLSERDKFKATNLVPFCDNTLALGDCPDFWNCQERHALFVEHDKPADWVPKTGVITFSILYYHTAVAYSARLIASTVNGRTEEYPRTYVNLSLKMGMYFSKESNRQLHGIPQVGDICAVAQKINFFERCQVVKVLSRYEKNNNPKFVLVRLMDEERFCKARDIDLFHLPDNFRQVNTHVVHVKLANIQPKDKDITFSYLAKDQLRKLTENHHDIFMRANIALTIGNTVLVENLEACQDLPAMRQVVVRYNFKEELMKAHAISNPDHVPKLQELCKRDGLDTKPNVEEQQVTTLTAKQQFNTRWAHLESDDINLVYFASAENPDKFFVRLEKFVDCLELLTKDVQKYVNSQKHEPLSAVEENDIVLAKFPDDSLYYRARVESVLKSGKVRCFFVDHGDWRDVSTNDLVHITEDFVNRMPFQAIECRLIGIRPGGDQWTEFSTNWFCDQCFEGSSDQLKELYVKYFTKQKAESTGGHKYGVAVVDTTTDQDIVINRLMVDFNLAQEDDDEIIYLDELDFKRKEQPKSDSDDDLDIEHEKEEINSPVLASEVSETEPAPSRNEVAEPKIDNQIVAKNNVKTDDKIVASNSLSSVFMKQPIRSVPLVSSDNSEDEWDVQMSPAAIQAMFKMCTTNEPPTETKVVHKNIPAILAAKNISEGSTCSSQNSEYEIVPSPRKMLDELDSDDLTSPEHTEVMKNTPLQTPIKDDSFVHIDPLKKPKLVWRQNKTHISIKIELIGVEEYKLDINSRSLKFETTIHDTDYGFEFDLYGGVDVAKSSHASKGLYIFVKLSKLLKKTWLSLTKDGAIKKWIVYDPDSIDASSDEDDEITIKKERDRIIESTHYSVSDDDDEDDNLIDDMTFRHRYSNNE
ncbi:hypothetical protein JYU34_001078 [Plutella xylostella]|uniref:RNA helicase n=1 Tax=Plutella xylostella TaxID=51655 RepID=A0ABQ7R617_PLUXY|nr:hypothetical protein JYU34_001078 [Plutella xylostella]